jgi:ATP-dependent RNA helicase DDX18/HAS1
LTPTREVAHQFLGVATELLEDAPQSVGIVTDQANFRAEAEKLTRGINLLIATPSQLLEHLKKTLAFSVKGLHTIILDDCERLMDTKTQESVKQILELLPKKKQIVLLTSTESSVAEGLPLKKPVTVRAKGTTSSEVVTDASRVQGYVMVSTDKRFILLFSFVKKFQKKKVVVVTSSTAAAKAYGDILNAMDLPVSQMHGKQNSKINASNLAEFNEAEQGTLICTDAVYQTLEVRRHTALTFISFLLSVTSNRAVTPHHDENKLVRVNEAD